MTTVNKTPRYQTKTPSRGGARVGAGRKKGSSPRYTLEELMSNLDQHLGMPYAQRVALNYAEAVNRSDWGGVRDYDRILLGKTVADKTEVTTVESEDAIEQRQAAFNEALRTLAGKVK